MLLQKFEEALRDLCDEFLQYNLFPETEESASKAVSEILEWVKENHPSQSAISVAIDFVECDLLHESERLLALTSLPITARIVAVPPSKWTVQEFYRTLASTYPYEDVDDDGEPLLLLSSFEENFTPDEVREKCKNIRNFANVTLHALKLKNS